MSKTVCAVCGSENVQHAMWVSVNTGEVQDDVFGSWCSGDNSWCEDCGEHTDLVEREEPKAKKPEAKKPKIVIVERKKRVAKGRARKS